MNVVEWCRKNDVWYLKIDLDIPQECIAEAQAVYDEGRRSIESGRAGVKF